MEFRTEQSREIEDTWSVERSKAERRYREFRTEQSRE